MGPGRLLAELDRRGWAVAGVDVSGKMVSVARVLKERLGGGRVPLHRPGLRSRAELERALDVAGLTAEGAEYMVLVLTSILRRLLPSVGTRVARRLEKVGPRTWRGDRPAVRSGGAQGRTRPIKGLPRTGFVSAHGPVD